MRVEACEVVRPVAEGNHINTTCPFCPGGKQGVCACLASLPVPNQEVKKNPIDFWSALAPALSLRRVAVNDAWVLHRDAGQGAAVAPEAPLVDRRPHAPNVRCGAFGFRAVSVSVPNVERSLPIREREIESWPGIAICSCLSCECGDGGWGLSYWTVSASSRHRLAASRSPTPPECSRPTIGGARGGRG
jgi:hypothetical protein